LTNPGLTLEDGFFMKLVPARGRRHFFSTSQGYGGGRGFWRARCRHLPPPPCRLSCLTVFFPWPFPPLGVGAWLAALFKGVTAHRWRPPSDGQKIRVSSLVPLFSFFSRPVGIRNSTSLISPPHRCLPRLMTPAPPPFWKTFETKFSLERSKIVQLSQTPPGALVERVPKHRSGFPHKRCWFLYVAFPFLTDLLKVFSFLPFKLSP